MEQQKELDSLQLKYQARAKELGISASALQQSSALPFVKARCSVGTEIVVRVLQWNLLAEGLSNDGFLVRNVLSEESDEAFKSVVKQVVEARESGEDMDLLKEKLASPQSSENHKAVLDWALRWTRMLLYVTVALPDIITLQELDHMSSAEEDLGRLGYECSTPGKRYRAAHSNMVGYASKKADPVEYFNHLVRTGVSFIPKTNSQCRQIGKQDDDGVAIFWRREVFDVVDVDFLMFEDVKRNHGAVRVNLKRKDDRTALTVIATHLNSGASQNDERIRMDQWGKPSFGRDGELNGPSLREWFITSASTGPTLFCMDSNSAPGQQFDLWRELCSLSTDSGARNLWSDFYDKDGKPLRDPTPVTTNKMRGPLSGQPAKIGEHAIGAIDNVIFSKHCSREQFAWEPLKYATKAEALDDLLPSLNVPSDHMPVIVDFKINHQAK